MLRGLSGVRIQLALAAALILLLAILATLQYRWIGEVSQAERDRMHASARHAAEGVAADFDREISRALQDFGLPPGSSDASGKIGPHVAASAKRWAAESRFPSLIREALVAERPADGGLRLFRVNLSSGVLEAIEWPPELDAARHAIEREPASSFGGARRGPPASRGPGLSAHEFQAAHRGPPPERPGPGFGSPARHVGPQVLTEVPAILIPDMRRRQPGRFDEESEPWLLLRLDERAAATGFLRDLVRRHFGETGEYDVAVLRRTDPAAVLYRSRAGFPGSPVQVPDAEVFFFGGGPSGGPARGGSPPMRPERGNRGPGPEFRNGPAREGSPRGAWRLVAVHRSGSLQAAVAASRRGNLAISAGILLLLAAAVATLLVSADRTRRLARQQVEFVAGITHELRTPLAAIRTAGQNLADGVIEERGRVRQYGELVVREGRRLSELIEQALAHAGIEARREGGNAVPVAIEPVIDEAIAVCRPLAEQRGTAIERQVAGALPAVPADRSALRTLLENLIANAVKYGGDEGRVLVSASNNARSVEIAVSDRGPGIASGDLPHIFEPFYRGQQSDAGRIAGSGLGLALVQRIARAFGGNVRVESSEESGTIFTVTLPAAAASGSAPSPPENP